MNVREHAEYLLEEFSLCCKAKPKHNAVDLQLEKDSVSIWSHHLSYQLAWGTDNDIAEACYVFEPKLNSLKEKLIFEVLTHGI